MITRVWHGWTKPENAAAYESLLLDEIFPGIETRGIAGYRGIELLRRETGDEVEFVTTMSFDSLTAVRGFAGENYEAAVVPPKARALLARFDEKAKHYAAAGKQRRDAASAEIESLSQEMWRGWQGDAWYGASLREALSGVTAEIALIRPSESVHNIWELVEHIFAWEDTLLRRLGGEKLDEPEEGDFPSPPPAPNDAAWERTLAKAERIHDRFLAACDEQTSESLERIVTGKEYNVRLMLHGALNHLAYHTGQIVLLKKLIS